MKAKNGSDLVIKIFLVVVAVILVGVLIAWNTGVFRDKKQDLNRGTEKIDRVLNTLADFDILVYEGNIISGTSLIKMIDDKVKGEEAIAIGVKTLAGSLKYYNYMLTTENNLGEVSAIKPPQKRSDNDYINPTGNFQGEITRNQNKEIVGIIFTQQK